MWCASVWYVGGGAGRYMMKNQNYYQLNGMEEINIQNWIQNYKFEPIMQLVDVEVVVDGNDDDNNEDWTPNVGLLDQMNAVLRNP